MPQLSKEYTQSFPDGSSVDVALYQSDKGQMCKTSYDGSNPFNYGNHGAELQIWREEIMKRATEELKCKPEEIFYVEQVGQHWQDVPFSTGENGEIKVPTDKQIKGVSERSVKDEISRHTRQSMGEEHLHSQDWTDHMERPEAPGEGPDR